MGKCITATLLLLIPLINSHAQIKSYDLIDKSSFNIFNPVPAGLMREMNADRPDKTDCPFTVDAGHFQLEMDFANITYNYANESRSNVSTTAFEIAPLNLKIGLLSNLDFQLVLTPYCREKSEQKFNGTTSIKEGFNGITPRLKINLIGNDGGFFALALIPFVSLPVSRFNSGNSLINGGIGIPFAFDIPNWDVGFQTTFIWNQNELNNGYHTEFQNSVSIGHSLLGKLSFSAEIFSCLSTEIGTAGIETLDTWLTYQVSENLRIDGGTYLGITTDADDLHLWIGMTMRY